MDQSTEQVLQQLSLGIEKLGESGAWRAWLATQAKFHKYSFANSVLIFSQKPNATQVAGFARWLELGRHVRKGEHGIGILAPIVVRRQDPASCDQSGAGGRELTGFRRATVFDISQTEGAELPKPCARLTGSEGVVAELELRRIAMQNGFSVELHEFVGETNGDCNHAAARIRIRAGLTQAQTVKTLAHEVAHALLHQTVSSREIAELEAESVAYGYCLARGIDSSSYSFGYLAAWAGGAAEAKEAIRASGQNIQKALHWMLGQEADPATRAKDPAPASATAA